MDLTEHINQCLLELGRQVGLEDLMLSEELICGVTVEPEIALLIELVDEPEAEHLKLMAILGQYDQSTELSVLRGVAEANFLFAGNGLNLAANTEDYSVLLLGTLPTVDINTEILANELGRFVEVARDWRANLWPEDDAKAADPPGDEHLAGPEEFNLRL